MITPDSVPAAGVFGSGAFGYMFDYFLWCGLFVSLLVHTYCFFRLFPRRRLPKLGLILGNGLVFLCMLGAVAMVAESYLRFVAVYTDAFGVSLPARRWFALHTDLNAMGCRDSEWSMDKPPGAYRIAFVGDSYTYGWGIERVEDRFPDLIQSYYAAHSRGAVEVMNVAKPGWGTEDQIRPIRDMIDHLDADEIVLCYVPNDIEPLIPTTEGFNPTRPPDYQFINLDSSPLLDYLYRRIYLPLVPTVRRYHDWLAEAYVNDEIWREHAAQLAEIADYCRSHDTALRVVLLPFLITSGDRYDADYVHGKLRTLFQGLGVGILDMRQVLGEQGIDPRRLVVNSLDAHPNEEAHALFAEAMWIAWYEDQVRGRNGE